MGNQSPEYQVTQPLDYSWQEVVLSSAQADSLNFVLLKNIETGEEAQEYVINLPTDNLEEQLQKYNLRNAQNFHLVSIKNVEVLEGGGPCSGVKNCLRVVTQRIMSNLATRPKLTEQESKIVLRKCLIGFKAIFQFEGYIPVHSKLIFFNQYGETKVWMNEDLPLNQPQYQYVATGHNAEQTQMIQDILATIQFHCINPKQFSQTRQKLMTGPLTFDRCIALLGGNGTYAQPRSRVFSSSSTSRALSPQTQSMVRAIESQGLRVLGTKQNKRYVVEEPGKIMYRQIESPKSNISHNQLKYHIQTPKLEPIAQTLTQIVPRRQSVTFKPPTVPFNQSILPTNSIQVNKIRHESPSRVLLSPQKSNQLIDLTFTAPIVNASPSKHMRIVSKEQSHQMSPVRNQQFAYPVRNVNSPSRNSIKLQPQNQIVSSPYFQQKMVQSPQHIQTQPIQLPQQPSYIVNQPIIRINPKKDIQISRVSRVSINSQNSNRSQSRVVSPKIIFSRIEPDLRNSRMQLRQSNQLSQAISGYARDSIAQSASLGLRKQPSITRNVPQEQQPEIQENPISSNQIQELVKPIQSTKVFNTKGNKAKPVQWIKISKSDVGNIQLSRKTQRNGSSKTPTQAPNSPVTPKDVMISYDPGAFQNNKFSITDMIPQSPNEYGIQVNFSSKQSSDNNSHVDTSKDSIRPKKKMVIYTDVATIHCDDAIIEGSNGKYKLSGEEQY